VRRLGRIEEYNKEQVLKKMEDDNRKMRELQERKAKIERQKIELNMQQAVIYIYIYICYVRVCVCVCVCVCVYIYVYVCTHTHTHTHTCIYIYIYIYKQSVMKRALAHALEAMKRTHKWVPPEGVDIDIDMHRLMKQAQIRRKRKKKKKKVSNKISIAPPHEAGTNSLQVSSTVKFNLYSEVTPLQ